MAEPTKSTPAKPADTKAAAKPDDTKSATSAPDPTSAPAETKTDTTPAEVKAPQTESTKRAAADRKAAATGNSPDDAIRAALKVERDGYVQRGLDDRVKQVDAQLKKLGK